MKKNRFNPKTFASLQSPAPDAFEGKSFTGGGSFDGKSSDGFTGANGG